MKTILRSIPAAFVAVVMLSAAPPAAGPRFYRDDPITRVLDTQDASKAQERDISLYYDAIINLFGRPGQQIVPRAESINTIDEVPDSSWFTNRAGTRPITPEEMKRGVNDDTGPAPGKWIIDGRKSGGVTPGFPISDERGRRYGVKFDAPGWPELGSASEVIVTRLFHALGYYVPQANIATVRREQLVTGPKAYVRLATGHRRPMRESDLDGVLRRAHREPDGSYRVVTTEYLPDVVGGFFYEGTRPDDPNDVIPHENRRELRGLRVFSAWVNHTDAKALNSIDSRQPEGDRKIIRHYLFDFNAALGSSGIGVRERRDGYEYLAETGPAGAALPAFGFRPRPWMTIDYPKFRGVGRFESARFVPEEWRPRVPNPAYVRSRPDDTFWAARKLMALPDDVIRAAVEAGRLSDPRAAEFLARALIERRDKIGRAWLTPINPVSDPALADDGTLTFRNVAVQYGFESKPPRYVAVWHRFDNETGETQRLGESESADEKISAPAGALTRTKPESTLPGGGMFIRVDISAPGARRPEWSAPVHAYFRHAAEGWKLVGFERMPDAPPMRPGLVGAEPVRGSRQERKAAPR